MNIDWRATKKLAAAIDTCHYKAICPSVLTLDPHLERLGRVLALEVEGGAGVVACVVPAHALQHQVLAPGQDAHAGRQRVRVEADGLQTNEHTNIGKAITHARTYT